MRLIILSLLSSFLLLSCGPRYVDFFPYTDEGVQKPRVSFVPVIDHAQCGLSTEFTEKMKVQFMDHGDLYLRYPDEVLSNMRNIRSTDLLGKNLNFASQFSETDFIVIIEIIDHRVLPFEKIYATFESKIRLRIIDVRCREPKIVLQEIINEDRRFSRKTSKSLMDFCHFVDACLLDKVVTRVERVICSQR